MRHPLSKLTLFFICLICSHVSAYSFKYSDLYYSILSVDQKTVMVTYENSSSTNYSDLTEAIIPDSVMDNAGTKYQVVAIDRYAFYQSANLEKVVIPNSVKTLKAYSFYLCKALKTVKFPNTLTTIEENAFDGCSALKSVVIPSSITTIDPYVFARCSSLESVDIPNSVTKISNFAFLGCSALLSVTIPSTVKEISFCAFEGCSELVTIDIPNSVTSVGDRAFKDCTKLETVHIGSMLSTLGVAAFGVCPSLKSIDVDPANRSFISEDGILYTASKNELIRYPATKKGAFQIPSTVSTVSDNAFYACAELSAITIPSSVKNLERESFAGCSNLTSVTIPGSVEFVNNFAFANCSKLADVTFDYSSQDLFIFKESFFQTPLENVCIRRPFRYDIDMYTVQSPFSEKNTIKTARFEKKITHFDRSVFDLCSGLTTVVIDDEVEDIGEYAFYGCTALKDVTLGKSLKFINNNLFYGCGSLTELTIPESVTRFCVGSFVLCGFQTFTIPNTVTAIEEAAFFNISTLETIDIPNSVKTLGESVFQDCPKLIEVRLPDSLIQLNARMFSGCKRLESVDIPDLVKTVGRGAFMRCDSLASVSFGKSVVSLSDDMFYKSRNLKNLSMPVQSLLEVATTAFDDMNEEQCTIAVPTSDELLQQYTSHTIWSKLVNGTQRIDVRSPEEVTIRFESREGKDGSHGARIYGGMSVLAKEGTSVTFRIVPDAGKIIKRVLYNDQDVTSQVIDHVWSSPAVNAASVLIIELEEDPSGVENHTAESVNAYASDGAIAITGDENTPVQVYTANGQCVYVGPSRRIDVPGAGLYIVRAAGRTFKVSVK